MGWGGGGRSGGCGDTLRPNRCALTDANDSDALLRGVVALPHSRQLVRAQQRGLLHVPKTLGGERWRREGRRGDARPPADANGAAEGEGEVRRCAIVTSIVVMIKVLLLLLLTVGAEASSKKKKIISERVLGGRRFRKRRRRCAAAAVDAAKAVVRRPSVSALLLHGGNAILS